MSDLKFDTENSMWIRPDTSDQFVLNEIFLADVYYIANMQKVSFALDIGANIGAFSSRLSRRFPDCKIISVEPEPSNFSVLQKNCSANPNITLINKAVWSHSDGVEIFADSGGTAVVSNDESFLVDSISFDELVKDFEYIDLMKMDVEGAEVEIILNASPDSLRKISKVTGEFHGYDPRWGDWVRYLGAFFELTIIPHEYPDHPYGGMFYGTRRV